MKTASDQGSQVGDDVVAVISGVGEWRDSFWGAPVCACCCGVAELVAVVAMALAASKTAMRIGLRFTRVPSEWVYVIGWSLDLRGVRNGWLLNAFF